MSMFFFIKGIKDFGKIFIFLSFDFFLCNINEDLVNFYDLFFWIILFLG